MDDRASLEAAFNSFAMTCRAQHHPKGSVILAPGDSRIGLILEGIVRSRVTSLVTRRREATVGLRGPGNWIGFEGFLDGGSIFKHEAAEDARVALYRYSWAQKDMPPDLRTIVTLQMSSEIMHLTGLHLTHRRSLELRLLMTLIHLKSSTSSKGEMSFTLRDIADLAGTTMARVSKAFKAYEAEGLLEKGYGKYLIGDADKLIARFRERARS